MDKKAISQVIVVVLLILVAIVAVSLIGYFVIKFVDRILPKEYRSGENVSDRGRILINDELTTPDKIIKTDPFFNRMRFNV